MKFDPFELETVADGGEGGGAAEPAEPATPVEPAVVDEPDVSLAEPVAPGIDWDDPEIAARVAGLSQEQTIRLLTDLGLVTFDKPAGPEVPTPDPLSDNYAAELEAWYAAKQAQTLEPVQAFMAEQQKAQVDQQIGSAIDTALTAADVAKPEDPAQAQAFTGAVRAIAESFTDQAVRQHGQTPAAAQAAVRMAVDFIVADRKAASDAAVEAYKQSLQNPPGSTPYEPGVRTAGIPGEGMPRSEAEVARLWRDHTPV
jgi:hypothetical protein